MTTYENSRFSLAVHVLVLLAISPTQLSSESLAETVNVHPVFLRRLMGMLLRAGLVRSRTGHGGGFRLAIEPRLVTLDRVYRAVGGGRSRPGLHRPVPEGAVGRTVSPWLAAVDASAEQAFLGALADRTLADALRRVREAREHAA